MLPHGAVLLLLVLDRLEPVALADSFLIQQSTFDEKKSTAWAATVTTAVLPPPFRLVHVLMYVYVYVYMYV